MLFTKELTNKLTNRQMDITSAEGGGNKGLLVSIGNGNKFSMIDPTQLGPSELQKQQNTYWYSKGYLL